MSKKKHSKTQQLLEQKRLLQQQLVSDKPVSTPQIAQVSQDKTVTNPRPALPAENMPEAELPVYQPTGLKRTLINTLIILVLLTGTIIIDHKTSYLQDLGNTLYTSLKLTQ